MTRVGVFIDGQNVTIGARHAFGNGNMHPLLLARSLAGSDTLVEVRYATGIPSAKHDSDRAESEQRRHQLMRKTDVVVLERELRYREQWEIRDRDLPRPRGRIGEVRQARVKAYNRGQEKGVDVWLALDALVMCARSDLDRVVIASADSDLDMVPDYLKMIPGNEGTTVDNARIVTDNRELRAGDSYDDTLAIDRAVFEYAKDDFDYTVELNEQVVSKFLARISVKSDEV